MTMEVGHYSNSNNNNREREDRKGVTRGAVANTERERSYLNNERIEKDCKNEKSSHQMTLVEQYMDGPDQGNDKTIQAIYQR